MPAALIMIKPFITSNLEATALPIIEPQLIVIKQAHQVKSAYLAVEGRVICQVKEPTKAVFVLIAAYYAYNMSYPKGLVSFYLFFEYLLFDKKPKKTFSCLSQFLTFFLQQDN